MPRRLVALCVFGVSAAVLVGSLAAIRRSAGEGISDRVVVPFGPAPTLALEADPIPAPAVDGIDLAALPEMVGPGGPEAPSVPVRSGLLAALESRHAPSPVRIFIGDIGLAADVAPVGYDARRDEMEVPHRPELVGWYRFGASPGEQGSAVLAAHVDLDGRPGAFFDLHALEAGAPVVVVMDDGSRQRWEVVARRQYGKDLLPTAAIFRETGDPVLALVTCGGPFDGRRYEDNVVVFARPVGATGAEPGPG